VTRPPVEVRRATVDDLDELLLLWAQAREESGHGGRSSGSLPAEQIRPRLREAVTSSQMYVLVARHEGVPAGYVVLRLAPVLALLDGPALHIDHLYVTPQTRRRGVARALLVATTAIAERHGAEQLLAGAPPSARESHRFLARLGFSPLVVRRVVGTATLRRRLAGEGQRRGLEDLLSRRRSLRARGLRVGWPGGGSATEPEPDDEAVADGLQAQGRRPEAAMTSIDMTSIDVASIDVTSIDASPVEARPADVTPIDLTPIDAPTVCAMPVATLPVEVAPIEGLHMQALHLEALQVDLEGLPSAGPGAEADVPRIGRRRRARA
jgi:ribosomal protein S18 acetylase RimI-like enzyme